jgi:hypothetical protein
MGRERPAPPADSRPATMSENGLARARPLECRLSAVGEPQRAPTALMIGTTSGTAQSRIDAMRLSDSRRANVVGRGCGRGGSIVSQCDG